MSCRLIALLAILSFAATASAQTSVPTELPPNLSITTEHSEDWTALTLAKSKLAPAVFNAVLLSKVEQPEFTREIIRMEWRTGDPIEVYVIRPHAVAKPPIILYLYDYTSDTDRFRDDRWCKRATQNGFAAVGFVSALSGQRFHMPRPMKEWFVSEMQEALGTSTHDVQMVLNYLALRDDLDAKTVGMFGQGSGGAIAILAAAADPRVVALDLLNPWGDWPDWLKGSQQIPESERALYLKPEFLQRVSMLDPVAYLPQLKLKALRIQQVMDDPVTPLAAKDKLSAAAPKPDEVVRYKDVVAHEKFWRISGLSGWLREQLRPTTVAINGLQTN
jgi:acetyl esterase/lipase